MKKYELLFTLPGTLGDKEVAAKANAIINTVKEHGSEVEFNNIGKIRLAYSIKQIRYGYFYAVAFQAEPGQIPSLENKLRLDRELLRFLISYYNTSLTTKEKITYSTSDTGVTLMQEKSDKFKTPRREEKRVSLEEIDKKLDALLDNEILP